MEQPKQAFAMQQNTISSPSHYPFRKAYNQTAIAKTKRTLPCKTQNSTKNQSPFSSASSTTAVLGSSCSCPAPAARPSLDADANTLPASAAGSIASIRRSGKHVVGNIVLAASSMGPESEAASMEASPFVGVVGWRRRPRVREQRGSRRLGERQSPKLRGRWKSSRLASSTNFRWRIGMLEMGLCGVVRGVVAAAAEEEPGPIRRPLSVICWPFVAKCPKCPLCEEFDAFELFYDEMNSGPEACRGRLEPSSACTAGWGRRWACRTGACRHNMSRCSERAAQKREADDEDIKSVRSTGWAQEVIETLDRELLRAFQYEQDAETSSRE